MKYAIEAGDTVASFCKRYNLTQARLVGLNDGDPAARGAIAAALVDADTAIAGGTQLEIGGVAEAVALTGVFIEDAQLAKYNGITLPKLAELNDAIAAGLQSRYAAARRNDKRFQGIAFLVIEGALAPVVDPGPGPTPEPLAGLSNDAHDWLTYETIFDQRMYRKNNQRLELGLYRIPLANVKVFVRDGIAADVLQSLGAAFFPDLKTDLLERMSTETWKWKVPPKSKAPFLVPQSPLRVTANREENLLFAKQYAVLPFNYEDNGDSTHAIGHQATTARGAALQKLNKTWHFWKTASRSLAVALVPVKKSGGPWQKVLAPSFTWTFAELPPRPANAQLGASERATDLRTAFGQGTALDFTDASQPICGVKTGVQYVGWVNQQAQHKDKLEENSVIACLRSDFIVEQDKLAGRKSPTGPDLVLQTELMSITERDPTGVFEFGDGVQMRDFTVLDRSKIYFPPISIPFVDRGLKTLKRRFECASDATWRDFWKTAYAERLGKAKAILLLRYGMQMGSPNAQNMLLEFTPGDPPTPTGRVVIRDVGDMYLHREVLWARFGGVGPPPKGKRDVDDGTASGSTVPIATRMATLTSKADPVRVHDAHPRLSCRGLARVRALRDGQRVRGLLRSAGHALQLARVLDARQGLERLLRLGDRHRSGRLLGRVARGVRRDVRVGARARPGVREAGRGDAQGRDLDGRRHGGRRPRDHQLGEGARPAALPHRPAGGQGGGRRVLEGGPRLGGRAGRQAARVPRQRPGAGRDQEEPLLIRLRRALLRPGGRRAPFRPQRNGGRGTIASSIHAAPFVHRWTPLSPGRSAVDAELPWSPLSVAATPEARWLAAFHAGDRAVLEQCYRDHYRAVVAAVGRILAEADAETVTHEVFYRLLSDRTLRENFQGGSFSAWLPQVATNGALDHLPALPARAERFPEADEAPPEPGAAAAEAEDDDGPRCSSSGSGASAFRRSGPASSTRASCGSCRSGTRPRSSACTGPRSSTRSRASAACSRVPAPEGAAMSDCTRRAGRSSLRRRRSRPRAERAMREHLPACALVPGPLSPPPLLSRLDPEAPAAEERIARGLGLGRRGLPRGAGALLLAGWRRPRRVPRPVARAPGDGRLHGARAPARAGRRARASSSTTSAPRPLATRGESR